MPVVASTGHLAAATTGSNRVGNARATIASAQTGAMASSAAIIARSVSLPLGRRSSAAHGAHARLYVSGGSMSKREARTGATAASDTRAMRPSACAAVARGSVVICLSTAEEEEAARSVSRSGGSKEVVTSAFLSEPLEAKDVAILRTASQHLLLASSVTAAARVSHAMA